MPPRIPFSSRASISILCFRPAPISNGPLPFSAVANISSKAKKAKSKHRDPYAIAQAKQRKTVNQARQAVLKEERAKAAGDPIRGVPTPFLESFDDVGGATNIDHLLSFKDGVQITSSDDVLLNHFLKPSDLVQSLEHSKMLTEPVPGDWFKDPAKFKEEQKKHEEAHARALAALPRILSLANASQEEKTQANTRRCIEVFGRHNTDKTLRPRPAAAVSAKIELPEKTPRAGPDTGSSEVQIAILTAKIKVLANQIEMKGGHKDKINKRNLRVMVHKRQKLLRYLRTKERGGERWKHLVETLGLSEATWKGEISL